MIKFSKQKPQICDRCANIKIEELTPVKVGKRKQHWCEQCVDRYGHSVTYKTTGKVSDE